MGTCTHSRRYVDWEIKATLQQGAEYPPNGLLGVALPSATDKTAMLPPRLYDNLSTAKNPGYAYYYRAPGTAEELIRWIEDAYEARTTRARLVKNTQDRMRYNATCDACGIVHPAS